MWDENFEFSLLVSKLLLHNLLHRITDHKSVWLIIWEESVVQGTVLAKASRRMQIKIYIFSKCIELLTLN